MGTLKSSKLIHYYFLRHGNTEPAAKGQKDINRIISDKGKEQALVTNEQLKEVNFDFIFCSPAQRAIKTVGYVLGHRSTELKALSALYPINIKDINDMFAKYKYSPLSTYFADTELSGGLHLYGRNAAKVIEGELSLALAEENAPQKEAFNVLIGGHAVCLNALAYYLANYQLTNGLSKGNSSKKKVLETAIGEAEYMELTVPLNL